MDELRLKAESPRDAGIRKQAAKMALRGQQLSGSEFYSQQMPWCDDPQLVGRRVKAGGLHRAVEVAGHYPCRRCEKCLTFRKLKWRERALVEIEQAAAHNRRTWFVSLTFSPVHLAGVLAEAANEKGPHETRVEKAAYRHVQRYFKRLRKAGARFRYLCVFERGSETGRPHYHAFIHELGPKPILHAMLDQQWRSFANPKLVRGEDALGKASYITTYATKSFHVRPRASAGYGKGLRKPQPPLDASPKPRNQTVS